MPAPTVALRVLPIGVDVPLCGACEYPVQLSLSHPSAGFAAVFFTSGAFALSRGPEPDSEPRAELAFSREKALGPRPNEELLPLLLLLLFALASHLAAQSSAFAVGEDCGAEITDEPMFGWLPR